MWSGDFTYNTKCIIQGFFVLGVWYTSYNHQLPEPKKDGASFLFAAFLFWIVYVMNAILDGEYGCDHGSFYDRLWIGSAN